MNEYFRAYFMLKHGSHSTYSHYLPCEYVLMCVLSFSFGHIYVNICYAFVQKYKLSMRKIHRSWIKEMQRFISIHPIAMKNTLNLCWRISTSYILLLFGGMSHSWILGMYIFIYSGNMFSLIHYLSRTENSLHNIQSQILIDMPHGKKQTNFFTISWQ